MFYEINNRQETLKDKDIFPFLAFNRLFNVDSTINSLPNFNNTFCFSNLNMSKIDNRNYFGLQYLT